MREKKTAKKEGLNLSPGKNPARKQAFSNSVLHGGSFLNFHKANKNSYHTYVAHDKHVLGEFQNKPPLPNNHIETPNRPLIPENHGTSLAEATY